MGGAKSKKRDVPEIVLPLFGPGNSGKTTFFNQIKIRRLGGFTQEQRDDTLQMIRDRILFWANLLGPDLELGDDSDVIMGAQLNMFTAAEDEDEKEEAAKTLAVLKKLFAPGSKACKLFDSKDHPEKIESDKRIIERAADLCSEGYATTDDDILYFRCRTTGEPEPCSYVHENKVKITYMDLGGQRIERSHWTEVKDPWGVIFIVGIDCYNQVESDFGLDVMGQQSRTSKREGKINALQDSLEVFAGVAKKCLETKIPLVLLLNKVDLFERNVQRGDMGKFLKDYTGGTDLEAAKKFMQNLFLEEVPSEYRKSNNFQSHFIKLVDGSAAENILQIVQKIIIQRNMAASFSED